MAIQRIFFFAPPGVHLLDLAGPVHVFATLRAIQPGIALHYLKLGGEGAVRSSAGIDGALHLVAKLKGYNTARATAYNMEYDNWRPNSGLLLSEDDPYRSVPPAMQLKEYVGLYEHWSIPELEIRYNERDLGLEVIYRDLRYPLYYQSKDVFTDVDGDTVTFERDEDGNISGYGHSSKPSEIFAHL